MAKTGIPDEVRDCEAAALRALLDAMRPRPTNEAFGKQHGIGSPGMVWQYISGHRPLNLAAATKFAMALNVPIERFSPRLAAAAALARKTANPGPSHVVDLPTARESDPAYGWPFAKLDLAAIRRLSSADLSRLEDACLVAAGILGLQIAKQRAA